MESVGNTTTSLLDAFDPSLAAVPPEVDPTPYAYFGTSTEVEGYDAVNTIVVADHSGTLFMEFSMDNEIWDTSFAYQYPEAGVSTGTAMYRSVPTLAKYYRSGFINTTDFSQNTFRLQTLLHENSRQLSAEFDSVTIAGGTIDVSMGATNSILSTIADRVTEIKIIHEINQVGSKGNVISPTSADGTLGPLQASQPVDVSMLGNSVISYEDNNTTSNGNLLVFASVVETAGSYVCIGVISPVASESTFRYAFNVINLLPFNYLYIYNNSATNTNTNITCSLYGS